MLIADSFIVSTERWRVALHKSPLKAYQENTDFNDFR